MHNFEPQFLQYKSQKSNSELFEYSLVSNSRGGSNKRGALLKSRNFINVEGLNKRGGFHEIVYNR